MGQLLQLEDFAQPNVAPELAPVADTSALKSVEKQGFDKGYHAGWEDAVNEARSSEQKAQADAAAALQQMDFTYFEARQHVMNSFKPLLEAVMGAVLPTAAQHALVPLVQEELEKLAAELQSPIDIFCAPDTAPFIAEQIDEHSKLPVSVKSEETLTSSQVQLRFSDGMTSVDMDSAIERIQTALKNFFETSADEVKRHG